MAGEAYREYLESKHWQNLRLQKIKLVGRACQACKSSNRIEVHHAAYRNPLESGTLNDLLVLCQLCHSKFHRHLQLTGKMLSHFNPKSTLSFLRPKTQKIIRNKQAGLSKEEAANRARIGSVVAMLDKANRIESSIPSFPASAQKYMKQQVKDLRRSAKKIKAKIVSFPLS